MGAIQKFDISPLIEAYQLTTFVETGTLRGDGVQHALQFGFDKAISIEIEPTLAKYCQARFSHDPRVHILQGDSSEVINDALELIDGNALFWLDAHFPGADAGLATYRSCLSMAKDTYLPLMKEMEAISKRCGTHQDCLIIDDLWLFVDGQYGAGNVNAHCAAHGHDITREEIVGDQTIQFAYDLFEQTHKFKSYDQDQGYLVINPK